MNLRAHPVVGTYEQAEFELEQMRQIFNECLPFMSKPIPPITKERQERWWRELPDKVVRFKAFVYTHPRNFGIVAFSLLQWHKDGKTTPLFGITKTARGQGLAREIIQHYLAEADGPLHGEELSSHQAIIKLNQEAGWQLLREEAGVRYLYHPNERRSYPDYQGMIEYWDNG